MQGFLGIEPNFTLWKNFFSARLQRCWVGSGDHAVSFLVDVGSVTIQPKNSHWVKDIYSPTPSSHPGWQKRWFYLCNDAARPFPEYTGCIISEASES